MQARLLVAGFEVQACWPAHASLAVASIVARSIGSMTKRVGLGLFLSQRAAKDAAATPGFGCSIASAVG